MMMICSPLALIAGFQSIIQTNKTNKWRYMFWQNNRNAQISYVTVNDVKMAIILIEF